MPQAQPITHLRLAPRPSARDALAQRALRFFDGAPFDEAKLHARRLVAAAERCARCTRVLHQLRDRLGSTLFFDDDPRQLIQAFDPEDRDGCTLRMLAACIVLYGRERVTLH
jgi:hypothetical protein